MAALISMKRTAEEVLDKQKEYDAVSLFGDEYPYGLRIHLDEDTVRKLKYSFAVGEDVMMTVKAHVKRVSTEEEEAGEGEGDTSSCVELQITDMAVEASPKSSSDRANSLYPSMRDGE